MRAKGVDVNKWRGKFPWDRARAGLGISFAYVRMSGHSEGDVEIDPRGAEYRRGARGEGLLTGAYHGLVPGVAPSSQAVTFYEALVKAQAFFDELPPAVDVELAGVDEQLLLEFLREFWRLWEVPTIIYTSRTKWNGLVGKRALLGRQTPWVKEPRYSPWPLELWVAHYTDKAEPALPEAWGDWLFWQYTSKAKFEGYGSVVDLNRYAGTEEELRARFKGMIGSG